MRMLARQIGAADGDRPAKPFERLRSAIALPDSRLEEARLAGTARVTLVSDPLQMGLDRILPATS